MPDKSITFTGGDALERKLLELAHRLGKAETLRVGFLEGATYPDGTSVPMVAAIQEYGSPQRKIPSRPYFRNMINAKSPRWADSISKILPTVDYDAARTLALMGEGIAGQLRESIRKFDSVPLSPVTIAKKGFDKQLIDTSVMLNSIDYEIVDGSE
jgi:hypothetical protein